MPAGTWSSRRTRRAGDVLFDTIYIIHLHEPGEAAVRIPRNNGTTVGVPLVSLSPRLIYHGNNSKAEVGSHTPAPSFAATGNTKRRLESRSGVCTNRPTFFSAGKIDGSCHIQVANFSVTWPTHIFANKAFIRLEGGGGHFRGQRVSRLTYYICFFAPRDRLHGHDRSPEAGRGHCCSQSPFPSIQTRNLHTQHNSTGI